MDIKEKRGVDKVTIKISRGNYGKSKEVGELSKLSFYRKDEHHCKSWLLSIVGNCREYETVEKCE